MENKLATPEVFKLDFCPLCGSVLSRPQGLSDFHVKCYGEDCPYKFSSKELIGKTIYHKQIKIPKERKLKKGTEAQGPTMTITCQNCGETEATYYTRQLRSADEGQTIFYKCLTCGRETKEDS